MAVLPPDRLTLLVGSYAQQRYLPSAKRRSLTERVQAFEDYVPAFIPLPHPSWRSTGWMKRNPWFETKLLPLLRKAVRQQIGITAGASLSQGAIRYLRENKPPRAAGFLGIDDRVAAEVRKLLDAVRSALDHDRRTAIESVELLATLLTAYCDDRSCLPSARGGLAPWQEHKVQRYIDENLVSTLPVGDLAALVSLSPSYFTRAFRRSFGAAPHAYIIKMRLDRARSLMLTTTEKLSQIALACGLSDQAHLCRWFRQVTGTTPGAWRRGHVDELQSVTATR
jgi:AraC-like DNA-binding protein